MLRGPLGGGIAAAVIAIAALTGAGTAAAAPSFSCGASALRASVAGQPAVEPAAIAPSGGCAAQQATPAAALPPLLSAATLTAATSFDPAAGLGTATGAVASLSVLPTPQLVAQLPTEQAIAALPAVTVSVPLVGPVVVDIRPAVRALVPAPSTPLLAADLLEAQGTVGCAGNVPQLNATSTIAGLRLGGTALSLDAPLDQAITVLSAQHVDPKQLDPALFQILTPIDPTLATTVQQAAALLVAPIDLPASVLQAHLVPAEQLAGDGTLTRRALHAQLTLLSQPVLDAIFGEATVGAAPGACAPAPAPATTTATAPPAPPGPEELAAQGTVAQQILACSDRRIVLIDVLRRGSRVQLLGAADRRYAGRRVAIRLRATGRVVAHALVRPDGSFQTTAPLPPRALLATHRRANAVRYRAELGKELSLPLKLQRRMVVTRIAAHGGRVTITGRVVPPLTTPVSTIRLVRRVSCHKVVLVKRFRPRADGRFRVTVKAPAGARAAIYRLVTSVREKPGNPRSYPTFTLPRGVALKNG